MQACGPASCLFKRINQYGVTCVRLSAFAAATAAILSSMPPALAAGNATDGKKKAQMCHSCHGPNGMAVLPNAANLAGQTEMYLKKALHDFKSGARKQENMTVVVEQLSDQDIADLAAFYSAIKITVENPK